MKQWIALAIAMLCVGCDDPALVKTKIERAWVQRCNVLIIAVKDQEGVIRLRMCASNEPLVIKEDLKDGEQMWAMIGDTAFNWSISELHVRSISDLGNASQLDDD
jgi:hypothetical protein